MNKIISEVEKYELKTREYVFLGALLFLLGMILGIMLSPKGERTVASHNGCNCGNNNGNNNSGCLTDESKIPFKKEKK